MWLMSIPAHLGSQKHLLLAPGQPALPVPLPTAGLVAAMLQPELPEPW